VVGLQLEGETGKTWTLFECEAVVASYFRMLRMELSGERYSKAEVIRNLRPLLPARSPASVDRKLQNVSAVLEEAGRDWIDGYKPLHHYQQDLKRAVLAALYADHRISEQLADYGTSATPAPSPRRLATTDVLVSPPGSRQPRAGRTSVTLTGSPHSALRDFQRRALGTAGEQWVIDLEREQLRRSDRDDLAGAVRWVARDDGDGAGYDIRSFRPTGEERLIEVKTTNLGPRTPFYITRWEVDVSRDRADRFSLYRVHGFARDPRIYVLDGSVEERARLEPKVYLGLPI
jgi:hypothetical protein